MSKTESPSLFILHKLYILKYIKIIFLFFLFRFLAQHARIQAKHDIIQYTIYYIPFIFYTQT